MEGAALCGGTISLSLAPPSLTPHCTDNFNFFMVRFRNAEADPGVAKFSEILVGHARARRAEAAVREARERKPAVDIRKLAMLQEEVALQANEFNDAVEAYRVWMNSNRPADLNPKKIEFEAFFNRFSLNNTGFLNYFLRALKKEYLLIETLVPDRLLVQSPHRRLPPPALE